METFLLILKIAAGPVIGGLIGLLTNYIAIKMLFRPYKEKRIGKWRVPFTPGMIPKRQNELAKAVGRAVSESLLTTDDIKQQFTSNDMCGRVGEAVAAYVFDGQTVLSDINGVDAGADKIAAAVSKKIVEVAKELGLGDIIASKAQEAASEGLPAFLSAMIPAKLLGSLLSPLGGKVDEYIEDSGYDLIYPAVKKELDDITNNPLNASAEKYGLTRGGLADAAARIYGDFMADKLAAFASQLDVAGIIEKKISEMDMHELEKLVLSVMKKELTAIVWLGGLLGFVIGIATSLITLLL